MFALDEAQLVILVSLIFFVFITRPRGKTVFMLNSIEDEIYPAFKSQQGSHSTRKTGKSRVS